jgi:hypothetical protein
MLNGQQKNKGVFLMNENLKLTGQVSWELTKADGTVVKSEGPNTVTDYEIGRASCRE